MRIPRLLRTVPLVISLLTLAGCPSAERTQKSDADTKPEFAFRVASLNMASFNRRLEKKDINAFVRVLKREQVDIVAVQNVIRYPGLETRIDPVREISAQADMRTAFGEMADNAGRQTGNAVLSTFPIRSNANNPFDGVKSATFESALQTVIDAGVRDILVVAVTLPPKASTEDQAACIKRINAINPSSSPYPMIVAGNLPPGESVRKGAAFEDAQAQFANVKNASTRIWFSGSVVKPIAAKSVDTELGTMTIVQFGIFRPTPL